MIEALMMERFKCFDALTLPLAPLTLFTGFNAAGKSTALQTLLLLSQTMRTQRGPAELRLKGALTNLGTPADVINWKLGGVEMALGLKIGQVELLWKFSLIDDGRRALRATRLDFISGGSNRVFNTFDGLQPHGLEGQSKDTFAALKHVIFLSGSRQVETDLLPVPEESEDTTGDVGAIGQFAAWWFHQEGDNPAHPSRNPKGLQAPTTLRNQLNAWAADLFPGIEFNAVPVSGTSLMRLEIKSGPTADWTRPANVGYGISYAFPTLVAGLTAAEGSTLVIDSPEAHLHPRGQARMGAFLAQMAAAGVQVLIETHSDHVMDGVRIAIRESILSPRDSAFHYFKRNESSSNITITTPQIDDHGRLSEWPEGFFDQHRRNMAHLVRPKADKRL